MFDPHVIYDGLGQRFWMAATENGTAANFFLDARIHLVVSKGTTPDSWAETHWTKCTFGAEADKDPIGVEDLATKFNDSLFSETIPDRCSLAADASNLYIAYRELSDAPGGATASPSVILVVDKASVTGEDPINVKAALRVDAGMAMHSVVRDYAIDPLADPGIWVVSKGPTVPPLDQSGVYNYIRLARVAQVGGVWTYNTPMNLSLGSYAYRKACASGMPGGRYRVQEPPSNNCSIWANDTNSTFLEFSSAVTRLDPNGVRKIWTVNAVRPAEAGDSECPTSLQWYEIDPAAGTVVVSRYTLPDGDYAHDPSIAVNANGDMVITFNRSYADPAKYPGVWRLTKPYGAPFAVTEEKPGPSVVYRPVVGGLVGPYWADFACTEPDPVDGCQFWAHHMTVLNNPLDACGYIAEQWRSYLFRFRLICPSTALRGNLDMDQDGELTSSDIEIYATLASEGDPEMDRTEDEATDVSDFVDFLNEWDDPE